MNVVGDGLVELGPEGWIAMVMRLRRFGSDRDAKSGFARAALGCWLVRALVPRDCRVGKLLALLLGLCWCNAASLLRNGRGEDADLVFSCLAAELDFGRR